MEVLKIDRYEYKFIFKDAGDTMGHLLQAELLNNPVVTFAAYRVPHPLESKMIVHLKTSEKSPREVMSNAFTNLMSKLDKLKILVNPDLETSDQTNETENE